MIDPNKTYTVVMQFFPARHPRYDKFAKAVPHSKNPEALRYILAQGWEAAAEEIDAYIAASGGPGAHKSGDYDKTIKPPIVDENEDTRTKQIYKFYLKKTDVYAPILDYIASLPSGKVRQRFLRLAVVKGFEKEGTAETIRPMLSVRK